MRARGLPAAEAATDEGPGRCRARCENENNSHLARPTVKLSELPHRTRATVVVVDDDAPNDAIARRLRELGFVAGERVEVVAAGPLGAEPLLVQVGYTRFALRRREAARVEVRVADRVQAVQPRRETDAVSA
jgi:ferrous iron transport protein A